MALALRAAFGVPVGYPANAVGFDPSGRPGMTMFLVAHNPRGHSGADAAPSRRNPESVYLGGTLSLYGCIAVHARTRDLHVGHKPYGTLYIGVTSDLVKRIWEHRNNAVDGFTRRYGVHRLVHFERFSSMVEAIEREKELKKWRRAWKIALVEKANPEWRDLWPEISQ
jgi:putative endonuclease